MTRASKRAVVAFALSAAWFASGCATTQIREANGQPPPPKVERAAVAHPVASESMALSAFEEAVAFQSKELEGTHPDFVALERRWRAVLAIYEIPEAHYNLGVALEREGKTEEAKTEYERALFLKPSLRQAAVNLAVDAEARGETAQAAIVYARVARDFPQDSIAREHLASLYLENGQFDEAFKFAQEALLRDPRSLLASEVLARAAIGKRSYDLARLIEKRTEKLFPKVPELPQIAGDALSGQGDSLAAVAQYRRALSLDPGFLPARYALLAEALRSEQWAKVAEHANAILAAKPDEAAVVLARGVALRHLDKADEALVAYDRAETLAGERLPEVKLDRGVLLAKVKGDCQAAISELNAYLRAKGGVAPTGSQAETLIRDCEEQIEENRKAMEEAKAMQAAAAQKNSTGPKGKEPGAERGEADKAQRTP